MTVQASRVPAVDEIIVTKQGPMLVHGYSGKNFLCYDEQGNLYTIPVASYPTVGPEGFDATAYQAVLAHELSMTLGAVVKYSAKAGAKARPGKYVVIGLPNAKGHIKVAKLGGDNNRYVQLHSSLVEHTTAR